MESGDGGKGGAEINVQKKPIYLFAQAATAGGEDRTCCKTFIFAPLPKQRVSASESGAAAARALVLAKSPKDTKAPERPGERL